MITREELRKHIWPVDTFVDFDHGLYSAVQRLRDVLGDTAETPRYVETLPRRGYRFIGEVTQPRPVVPDDGPARGLRFLTATQPRRNSTANRLSRVCKPRWHWRRIPCSFIRVVRFQSGRSSRPVFRRTNTEAIRSLAVIVSKHFQRFVSGIFRRGNYRRIDYYPFADYVALRDFSYLGDAL